MAQASSGLVVWITGGGSGIGRSLALEMASRGDTVVISGRRKDRLDQVKDEIEASGGKALALACDVTRESETHEVVAQIAKEFGKLDICVANAGFGVVAKFEKTTPEEWRRQMDVNFFGAIWTMQAALPYLRETKGRLAVVSSVAGKLAAARISAYAASKFALVAVCNSLYQELAGSGVSVTNILPGFVDTEISRVGNDGIYREGRGRHPNKLTWKAEHAAKPMASAIYKRKREAVITGHGKFAAFLGQYLPGMTYWAMSRQKTEDLY
jgi:NAD(P)-dependent dehydrogenase (short-subunit alcohol dehydrogenase family)